MALITDITTALGDVFDGAGVRYLPYLSDTFSPPIVLIAIEDVTYNETFAAGLAWHKFTCLLIVNRVSDRAGAIALEGFMSNTGATSIRQLVQKDCTLGGVVDGAKVVKSGPPLGISVGTSGATYTSVPFDVEVLSS